MSQHNFDIGNVARSLFRGEVNNGLKALATLSSGTTAPATTYAFQLWMDTSGSPAVLKVRDAANSAWVTLGPIADSTQWRAYTANTERVRIDSTGKVGIGKTNPAYTLDVNGDINCTGSLRINGTAVGTIADGSITYAKIQNVSANAVLMRNAGTDGDVAAQVIPESALVGRGPGQVIGAVTLGTGLSMSGNVLNAAVGSSAGRLIGVQVFNASGSYLKGTNNPSFVVVDLKGGGGGGGASGQAAAAKAGSGGAEGGRAIKKIDAASLGSSVSVTVGAGGTRGLGGTGSNGSAGGNSSFGSFVTAYGGSGGIIGLETGFANSTDGGTSLNADISIPGCTGMAGIAISNSALAGHGGGSGGGASVRGNNAGNNGAANSGGGGSGGSTQNSTSQNGGNGGSGYVLVWEYS